MKRCRVRFFLHVVAVAVLAMPGCSQPLAGQASSLPAAPPSAARVPAPLPPPIQTRIEASKQCDGRRAVYCTVTIRGPIEAGAAQLLDRTLTAASSEPLVYVSLASPGGDVAEAMKMGRVLRQHNALIYADGPCYSACVFVFAGGVRRWLGEDGAIGVHRAFLDQPSTSIEDYRRIHAAMNDQVAAYLRDMDVSVELLDRIASIPSEDIDIMSKQDLMTLRLYGVDPTWQDFENGQDAQHLGLTTSELLERRARMNAQCGGEGLFDDLDHYGHLTGCKAAIMYAPPAHP